MQYEIGDVRELGASALMSAYGASLVVFHPTSRALYVGLGSDAAPISVPHCLARWHADGSGGNSGGNSAAAAAPAAASSSSSWTAAAAGYYSGRSAGAAALAEAARLMDFRDPLPLVGRDAAPPAGARTEREVAEGDDGFQWADTAAAPPALLRPAQPDEDGGGGGEARQPEEQKQQEKGVEEGSKSPPCKEMEEDEAGGEAGKQKQQQPQNDNDNGPSTPAVAPPAPPRPHRPFKGLVVGAEALRLPPGAPYVVTWPMAGGRLARPSVAAAIAQQQPQPLPDHLLLDDLEAVWAHALRQLGPAPGAPTPAGARDAVLVVPRGMPAREVRLLADLVLRRLGFRSLCAHLEPVAAAFGAGASAACVVDVAPEGTSVACVEDGVLSQADAACARGAAGADAVTRAFLGLLRAAGAWPGGAPGCALADAAVAAAAASAGQAASAAPAWGAYALGLASALRAERCYCAKAAGPGLVGECLLEDSGAAELPLRAPGAPTRLAAFGTAPWDALAPLVLLLPTLDPGSGGTGQQKASAEAAEAAAMTGSAELDPTAALPFEEVASGVRPALLPPLKRGKKSSAAGDDAMDVDGSGDENDAAAAERQQRDACRALVDEAPPAERLLLAQAARALVGDAGAGGGAGGSGSAQADAQAAPADAAAQQQQQQLPPYSAYLPGPTAEEPPPERAPLDQLVLQAIDAAAGGRTELRQRLLAGILLTGDGGGLRGLAGLLERRIAAAVAAQHGHHHHHGSSGDGAQQHHQHQAPPQLPMVNVLETKGDARTVAWRGGAVLAALDAASGGAEAWLTARQWAGAALDGPGAPPPGRSSAAVNRHSRLFAHLRAQHGGY